MILKLNIAINSKAKNFTTMDQPDKLLLESFRRGEGHALDKIYEYYKMPVIRFTVSIVKDEQEAENIYHEVFIKLLEKNEDIKPELNFNTYVFIAVRNENFAFLKAVKMDSVFNEKYCEKIKAQCMEEEEDKEEVLSRLEGIVQMLYPKRRWILDMNYNEHKS